MIEFGLTSYLLFGGLVVAALCLDLFAHKQGHEISMRDAAMWSVFWVMLSLGFAGYIWFAMSKDLSLLFLTGYFLEKSLSVDNLFVFIAIFSSFAVRSDLQHRVLYYGILGAVVMRLLFIFLGSSIIALFGKWALTVFGLFILWTAWKMWQEMRNGSHAVEDYNSHWSLKLARRIFPVHPKLEGNRFFWRVDGKLMVTPLLLCLVSIEIADVMFAFDSVPAIFAVFAGLADPIPLSTQTFLVYTSNIFAILGLRSLYFLLAAANRCLVHLEKAVIAILVFIGAKMLLGVADVGHIPAWANLAIILGLLLAGIVGSYLCPAADDTPTEES